jgi:tetratricopeptide (TPR) repeat protein
LEHESDVYAVNILNAQGYDLKEFARGFELLRKGPEVDLSHEPVFWASHPKLTDRVQYIASMANQLQANATGLRAEPASYLVGTRSAIRHDADLDMMLGRPRTAVAIAERLIALEPDRAEHYALLGDAYRTLGARTPTPAPEEQSEQGKKEARGRMRKMTLVEYDKALLADPNGAERWQANCLRSEQAFQKALDLNPTNAEAHRGLGFLYEQQGRRPAAIEHFKKYLELTPNASDARRIRMHVEALEKQVASQKPAQTEIR